MNRLDTERRALVIKALVDGNSLRATARISGVARMTVEKLLRDVALACHEYHDAHVRNLKSRRIQCDEIWSFIGAKERQIQKNPTIKQRNPDAGDAWTWTALDADSKLVISYAVGGRTAREAHELLQDVASRVSTRVQLTTDGFTQYLHAVEDHVPDADYGTLSKIYKDVGHKGRYSPPVCIGCVAKAVYGTPDPKHISTSYVERSNLTMRMSMRRFTRLTNAFSKKLEMHFAAVALHFFYYNFCRIHETLRVTPAMAAGIAVVALEIEDIINLIN